MKQMILAGLAACVAAAVAGCASVSVVKDLNGQKLTPGGEEPVAHINGDIYGYYLFGCIPLITGDPQNPGSQSYFHNTVKAEDAVEMVTRKSKELGASKLTDLTSREDSTGLQTLFIVWYRDVQVSGNAVK